MQKTSNQKLKKRTIVITINNEVLLTMKLDELCLHNHNNYE